jgi:predicted metal-dependent phosphoesterase TrpH
MKNTADRCDLHIHSHYSDGTLPPAELVRKAAGIGLGACSITDHDSIEGQREALREGASIGIEVLEGVEFSVHIDDQDIHILGYLVDIDDEELGRQLTFLGEARLERAKEIVSRLADSGLEIPISEVVELSGKGTVGRPHIAQILVRHGLVSGFQAAFGRYIGEGRSCYVPKTVLPLERVVDLIRNAGGVSVWAHPGDRVRDLPLLEEVLDAGVAGLEAYHPNHDQATAQEIERVAKLRGLVTTGGSDYHFFEAKQIDIGGVTAPYSTVTALRAAVI